LVFTPYSREEFELSWEPSAEPVGRARHTIIRAQMGFGSASATKGVTGFGIDTKRQYGTAQSLWATYPEQLAEAGQRLGGVQIENRPAIEIISATTNRRPSTTSILITCMNSVQRRIERPLQQARNGWRCAPRFTQWFS
jgi:hypothetical protein